MKYMLLIYNDPAKGQDFKPEEQQAIQQEWFAVTADAKAEGVLIMNDGLAPVTTARSVRVRDGESLVTDGPFAETHEHFGGFFLIDVPTMDEALRWAARLPTARYGTVEVRPMWYYLQSEAGSGH
jgi:hypothetical protein